VSEDCLYLNVWAPAGPRQRLPVLVWVHGGGFVEGSGSVRVYDGSNLAERGLIVVTINYRLGAFGFFAHPELTEEMRGEPPTNFGLQDQIAALKWIHENIAAFGGDPDAVTIAGQSAGALCVHALVTSPLAAGLFKRAIAESGPPNLFPVPSLKQAEDAGLAFAKEKGVDGIAGLRTLPPEALGSTPPNGAPRFVPVADGILLPEALQHAIAAGRFNDVSMIVGQVADEMSFARNYAPGNQDEFKRSFAQYGAFASRFQAKYPAATDAERVEVGRIMGQDRGLWSLWLWSQDRLTKGRSPVYAYMFNHVQPGRHANRFRVFHTSEVPYVFANLDAPQRNFTERDREVSDIISSFWVNFVKSGNPNNDHLPNWPRLQLNNPQILVIGDEVSPRSMLNAEKRALYDEYSASGGVLSAF
jgi:para-nitrobenzyl esterase